MNAASCTPSTFEEVLDEFLPLVRQHAFGMKLHALNRKLPVPQAHDDSRPVSVVSPGADFEIAGQAVFGDDQRVIAGCRHRRRQAAKDGFAVVLDLAGFAVHQVLRANHLASESCANGLVSEANSEQRHLAREMADQFDADAGFLRSAGSGRNDNALGLHRVNLFDRHFVVAANLNLGAQFANVLDEVVSERIVVIENEDHAFIVAAERQVSEVTSPSAGWELF